MALFFKEIILFSPDNVKSWKNGKTKASIYVWHNLHFP